MATVPSEHSPALLALASAKPEIETANRAAIRDWKDHAHSLFPLEAAGFLTADGFVAATNKSKDPARHFIFDTAEYVEAGEIIAILHSHTPGPELDKNGNMVPAIGWPSKLDMENQQKSAVPWGISIVGADGAEDPFWFGDQLPIQPLIGRVFMNGVSDCLTLIRDWHRLEHNISFPNPPRDMNWWFGEEDFYVTHYEACGFELTNGPMQIGDVFACSVRAGRSRKKNHGGVYIGGGVILHHLYGQTSRREAAGPLRAWFDYRLRHKNLPDLGDI